MSIFYRISRSVLKGLFTTFYKHTVFKPVDGLYPHAAIIAANHLSYLDPPLVSVSLHEEIYFLAGSHLFKNPIFRKLIQSLNAYPVSKSGGDIATFRTICSLLKDGKKVLIFPEGTRSKDGTISDFKRGLGMLAKKSGCPIIPAYIHGTNTAWPRGKKMPYFFGKRTSCSFGDPIFYEADGEMEGDDSIAQKTFDAVLALRNNIQKQIPEN